MGEADADDALLYFNGIDGETGQYFVPPVDVEGYAERFAGVELSQEAVTWAAARDGNFLGTAGWIDPSDLAETGWGVIFGRDTDQTIRDELASLLKLREAAAGPFYAEFEGPAENETGFDYLARHGVEPTQPADPQRFPYYVLLVGGPSAIPFEFQYDLDGVYAVGRLAFETPAEFGNYARSVVAAETDRDSGERRATLFGVRNPDDAATELSDAHLVGGLASLLPPMKGLSDWAFDHVPGDEGTKGRLIDVLTGPAPPAVLFTAGHGLALGAHHEMLRQQQGALICREWPGPTSFGPVKADWFVAADDIGDDARLAPMIAFLFACFGAGTPARNDVPTSNLPEGSSLSPEPFVSRLPNRLLGHPNGGALAVVGHVSPGLGFSFKWPELESQIGVFRGALFRILTGHRIGDAMEEFTDRHAGLLRALARERFLQANGKVADPLLVSWLWSAMNDARNFVILGDPAVRVSA